MNLEAFATDVGRSRQTDPLRPSPSIADVLRTTLVPVRDGWRSYSTPSMTTTALMNPCGFVSNSSNARSVSSRPKR